MREYTPMDLKIPMFAKPSVALAMVLVLALLVVSSCSARYDVRNRTVLRGFSQVLSGMHPRIAHAYVFDTGQEVRIIGVYTPEWETLGIGYDPKVPSGWTYLGRVQAFPAAEGRGLFAPWMRNCEHTLSFNPAVPASLTLNDQVRQKTAQWLLADPDWAFPSAQRYATLLAQGQGSTRWIDWPLLALDGVLVLLTCLTVGSLISCRVHHSAARRRLRAGRCPTCSYELNGLFDAGCPECGWNHPRRQRPFRDDFSE